MRALAAVFALFAVVCMTVAIVSMGTGQLSDRAGWLVRAAAVVFFATAVVLNIAAH